MTLLPVYGREGRVLTLHVAIHNMQISDEPTEINDRSNRPLTSDSLVASTTTSINTLKVLTLCVTRFRHIQNVDAVFDKRRDGMQRNSFTCLLHMLSALLTYLEQNWDVYTLLL